MFLVVGIILITSWKCCRELWLEFSEALGPDACITGFFLEGAGYSVLVGAWNLHPVLVMLTFFLSTWSPRMLQGWGQVVWAVSGHIASLQWWLFLVIASPQWWKGTIRLGWQESFFSGPCGLSDTPFWGHSSDLAPRVSAVTCKQGAQLWTVIDVSNQTLSGSGW